ncbi:hypothetical protein TrVE_jg6672 [Triparma verrucosa]|uniref:PLC-like phosphodiesterase n=1 Tax=Triparma verrucosa TaxID=1606542 RepID=A0A9W7B6J3_9STRA|nr:hypothetical protein TrVE_jg6672 [Triparma verrucosa]
MKLALLALLAPPIAAASSNHDAIPLDQYGMIMVHDAASGYLDTSSIITNEVYDWTRTQTMPNKSAADLLTCGARSFDWRPSYKETKLQAHHGDVTIEHDFSDSLDEILGWAASNPEELVIMHVWDCISDDSGDCTTEALKQLNSRGLNVIDDCNKLINITVGDAKALAKNPTSPGLVLPIMPTTGNNGGQACSSENYDASIACWGTKSFTSRTRSDTTAAPTVFDCIEDSNIDPNAPYTTLSSPQKTAVSACVEKYQDAPAPPNLQALFTYSCWDDSSSKSTPVDQMTAYMDKVSQAGPGQGSSNIPLYQIQALWEESTASVVIGELHLSSLVEDEAKSKLNALTTSYINADRFPNLNYVEVNNVCDGGPELLAALSAFNDKHVNARK